MELRLHVGEMHYSDSSQGGRRAHIILILHPSGQNTWFDCVLVLQLVRLWVTHIEERRALKHVEGDKWLLPSPETMQLSLDGC